MGRLFHEFAVTIMTAILISGVVSLTLTPMMCSRFLRPHGARRPRPALPGRSSGSGTCRCAAYERSLAVVMRHKLVTRRRLASRSSRGTFVLFGVGAQGLPAERGHRLPQRHHRRGGGAVVRRHGRPPASGGGGAGAGSGRRGLHVERRRRPAVDRLDQPGPVLPAPEAARRARAFGRRDRQPPARAAGAGAGHPRLRDQPAGDQHRRPRRVQPLPVHPAVGGPRARSMPRRRSSRPPCATRPRCATSPATCGSATPRCAGEHRPRPRGLARPDAARRSRRRSTRPTGRGRSRPSWRRTTSTTSSSSCCRSSSASRPRSTCCTCARRDGTPGAAVGTGADRDRRRAR